MLKTWPLPRTVCVCVRVCVCACVCVCVLVVVVGGGGSRRYNHTNIYNDPAIGYSITCVGGAVVTNAFHSHNACWYMRVLNNNGNERRR